MTKHSLTKPSTTKVYLRKRKDRRGQYEFMYYLPNPFGDEPIQVRRLKEIKRKVHAEKWADDKSAQLREGEYEKWDYYRMGIEPPNSDQMTLKQFLPRFRMLRERGRKRKLSERYIDTQEKVIERYLLPRFGDTALVDIDVDAIDDFVTDLQQEEHPQARSKDNRLAPHTVNNVLGILGKVLSVAARRGVIPFRPIIEKVPLEDKEELDDILRLEEVRRLFEACEGVTGRMIKAYVLTGCRAMELAGLKWEDYDPIARQLHIRYQIQPYRKDSKGRRKKEVFKRIRPKWNSVRWVPVGDELAAILNEQAAHTRLQDGFIFLNEKGRPFCNELIRKALRRTCRKAHLRVVSPQVLRRTFISHLVMANENPKTVQKIAGQKTLAVTMKYYTRLEDDFVQKAAKSLENRIYGDPGNEVEKESTPADKVEEKLLGKSPSKVKYLKRTGK